MLDNLRTTGVPCRSMFGFRCRACEAKDSEISRLSIANNALLDRLMIVAGKPDAVAPLVEVDESGAQEPPVDFLAEQEKALKGIAESRGMDIEEFADA